MFKSSQYDVIEVPVPVKGMNQHISPELLPVTQSYWLENILPTPLGQGQVRYGCNKLPNITLPQDAQIQEMFYFSYVNHSTSFTPSTPFIDRPKPQDQLLLYVQHYLKDESIVSPVMSENGVTFSSQHASYFIPGTPLKLIYRKGNSQHIAYLEIRETSVEAQTVTLTVDSNTASLTNATIEEIHYPRGSIYLYDLTTQQLNTTPLKENLAIHTLPRAIFFQNKLIVCNGVDRLLSWDGVNLAEIYDFVAENTLLLTKEDVHRFSCVINTLSFFVLDKYFPDQQIQLMIDNQTYTLTIDQVSFNEGDKKLTLTTVEVLPEFTVNMRLFYKDYPPRFSYLHVHKDRIYALSEGAVNSSYRSQPLYVYFTYRELSINNWVDETTKQTPFIDLSYTHQEYDQIEAIQSLKDQILFIGRRKTQIWHGTYPLDKTQFYWKSTIHAGVVHGNLVTSVSNHLLFVSPSGLVSLGAQEGISTTQAGLLANTQAQLNNVPQLDPLIEQYLKSLDNPIAYRQCRAFRYEDGPFMGFKIGEHETLINLINTEIPSWSVLSGLFKQASSFCAIHQQLFISKANQVYYYADGRKSRKNTAFTDDGEAIHFHWSLPIIQDAVKRFSCQRYEVNMTNPEITPNPANSFELTVYGDRPKAFEVRSTYPMDSASSHNLPAVAGIDDGIAVNRPYAAFKARMKFVAVKFWGQLSGFVTQGPVLIKSVKFLGRRER